MCQCCHRIHAGRFDAGDNLQVSLFNNHVCWYIYKHDCVFGMSINMCKLVYLQPWLCIWYVYKHLYVGISTSSLMHKSCLS